MKTKCARHITMLFLVALVAAQPLAGSVCAGETQDSKAAEPYPTVAGPCNPVFPADHGSHDEYRTEWWYYTGNLAGEDGRRFGFQLTFFRRRIGPVEPPGGAGKVSAWRTGQIYLAHAALTDISGKRLFIAEDMARSALGLAGAKREGAKTRIHLKGWSTEIDSDEHRLVAASTDFAFRLILDALKPPVAHGDAGYSLKGKSPEEASCYYSITRLRVRGEVDFEGRSIPVTGTAWMDHEFMSAPMNEELAGWDWFSLQLSDGSELMIYLMREKSGSHTRASGGTYVAPSGNSTRLTYENMIVDTLDHWTSPRSGGRYPARRRVQIPKLGVDLVVTPNLPDQELQTEESTAITYWEGSVSAVGEIRGPEPVEGVGYVELTGYAGSVGARF